MTAVAQTVKTIQTKSTKQQQQQQTKHPGMLALWIAYLVEVDSSPIQSVESFRNGSVLMYQILFAVSWEDAEAVVLPLVRVAHCIYWLLPGDWFSCLRDESLGYGAGSICCNIRFHPLVFPWRLWLSALCSLGRLICNFILLSSPGTSAWRSFEKDWWW